MQHCSLVAPHHVISWQLRENVPGLGPAARLLLLLPDESGQLLPERRLFAVGLLDEGMLQQVGDGGARLKILNQTP